MKAGDDAVKNLQQALSVNTALCKILVQRGADDFEKAKAYFRPQLSSLHDPYLMKDMHKAVQRIQQAFDSNEKILVYGDYDVDGTTAVACMFQFLKSRYEHVEFYLPHRYREGYGVSKAGIDHAHEHGVSLIVSLDCGIKSLELVGAAKKLNIDFIICDHHMPDAELPDAVAILNPKQVDCTYPYKELCGCGVGLKLIHALCMHYQLPDETWQQYLDLTATAIAADIVPMTGENRIMAYYGLKRVNSNPSTGIKALMQLAELKSTVHITNLVFVIAPRVNAAGRMDDARKAVLLFIEKDFDKALQIAEQLHGDNTERKETDKTITEEAMAMVEISNDMHCRKSTVLYQSHWHKGVVGIVASRLIDKYYRPTIVLTSSGDKVAGSARSVIGFNVYEAIHQCKDLLENYGGHFYAAGLTLKPENVEAFQERFEEVVAATIPLELLTPEVVIDAEVKFKDITPGFYNIVCQMEPYGPENLRPVFVARHVYETGYSRVLKDAHIKFNLKQENKTMEGIGFNMAGKFALLKPNVPLDVVFTIDENEWNGTKQLQLKVVDIRESSIMYN